MKPKPPESNISAPGHENITPADCLGYAQTIAKAMAQQNYPGVKFEVFSDLWGVLSQIDNMAMGMIRRDGVERGANLK